MGCRRKGGKFNLRKGVGARYGAVGSVGCPRLELIRKIKKNFQSLSLQAKDVFINVRTAIRDVRAQCQDYRSKARQKESE